MGPRQFYECRRCDREFRSLAAIQQHLRNSSRHNICHVCGDEDFQYAHELDDHLKEDHHYCIPCDEEYYNSWSLERHDIDVHNLCVTCGRFFKSPSNLENHMITHASKDVDCAGCNRLFVSNSAMVLHLEAGTCQSQACCQLVDTLASDYHQSNDYLSDDPKYEYQCPSCRAGFKYMSGLLQHVENGVCDENLSYYSTLGGFLEFIRSEL